MMKAFAASEPRRVAVMSSLPPCHVPSLALLTRVELEGMAQSGSKEAQHLLALSSPLGGQE